MRFPYIYLSVFFGATWFKITWKIGLYFSYLILTALTQRKRLDIYWGNFWCVQVYLIVKYLNTTRTGSHSWTKKNTLWFCNWTIDEWLILPLSNYGRKPGGLVKKYGCWCQCPPLLQTLKNKFFLVLHNFDSTNTPLLSLQFLLFSFYNFCVLTLSKFDKVRWIIMKHEIEVIRKK